MPSRIGACVYVLLFTSVYTNRVYTHFCTLVCIYIVLSTISRYVHAVRVCVLLVCTVVYMHRVCWDYFACSLSVCASWSEMATSSVSVVTAEHRFLPAAMSTTFWLENVAGKMGVGALACAQFLFVPHP